ncbi:MAG: hypothetical protein AMXMBFR12_05340 [Candidatus Babeliales bacterium]
MSFYSKISLFALMAAGPIMGMEMPPRLNHPAMSATAKALNQPMIKVFSDTQQIDTIQRNYLESSETFKNMLEDIDTKQTLVLPESMIEDYLAIQDLLIYEYRFKENTLDDNQLRTLLNQKTEHALVTILNACQRFELNKISECATSILAKKLNNPALEDYVKNNALVLPWTADVARLVAQHMLKEKSYVFHMLLTDLTERKQGNIRYWHVLQENGKGTRIEDSQCSLESLLKKYFPHFFRNSHFLTEPQAIKPANAWFRVGHLLNTPEKILTSTITDETGRSILYWEIDSEILKIFKNIKPEDVILLNIYSKEKEKMPLHLQKKLPQSIRQLLFPSWWQRRSWLSKAAIITASAATTGFAAWYGYKYFSKKK